MHLNAIQHNLNRHLSIVQKNYETNLIFSIFIKKIDEEKGIVYSEAFVIPYFTDVCKNEKMLDTELCNGEIKIIDARHLYQNTLKRDSVLFDFLSAKYIIITPCYQHIYDKLYKSHLQLFKEKVKTGEPIPELEIAINKLFRYAWNENSNTIKFLKQVTDAEKIALQEIIEIAGDEGYFFQGKTAIKAGTSRLIMANLIERMKKYGLIETRHCGPQGTYIKIIDDALLNWRY